MVPSAASRYALSWDDVGTVSGDVEILVMMQFAHTADVDNAIRCFVHGSGSSASESAYGADGLLSSNRANLTKYVSGTATGLASPVLTMDRNIWYWMRLQRTGTTIRNRVWADGGAEPGTWNGSVTDSSLSSGWVGVGLTIAAAGVTWVAKVGVGTGGDPAPDAPFTQTIGMNTIASGTTLYQPAVTRGAVTVAMNTIASGLSVKTPAIAPGSVTIGMNTIASGTTLYQPAVANGLATIGMNTISSGTTLYQPAVVPGSVVITMQAIASALALYQPAVTRGSVSIGMNTIASALALYQPSVTPGSVTIGMNTIASGSALYQPSVTVGSVTVAMLAIPSGLNVRTPAILPGAVTVAMNAIASGLTLYELAVAVHEHVITQYPNGLRDVGVACLLVDVSAWRGLLDQHVSRGLLNDSDERAVRDAGATRKVRAW